MAGSQPLLLPVRHSGGHTGEPAVMLSGKGLGFSFHSGGSGGAVGDLEGLGHAVAGDSSVALLDNGNCRAKLLRLKSQRAVPICRQGRAVHQIGSFRHEPGQGLWGIVNGCMGRFLRGEAGGGVLQYGVGFQPGHV